LWPGKLLVKGIMRADDAVQAFGCGADAVVVSNHGGRNLDSARAPIDVLPEVVASVGAGRAVMVDGGIRRGSDVVKAMALGAHAVLLGRLPLYGVASAGRAGVSHALTLLKREIELNLAMIGCPAIDGLNGDFLHRSTP
jgi:isopentenyl diphosphate isomerase/L-lactate dehydrogenase-like FMN-dependent dehydrogenase